MKSTAVLLLAAVLLSTNLHVAHGACGSCLGSLALAGAGLGPTDKMMSGTSKHPHSHHVNSAKPAVSKSALGFLATRHILSRSKWGRSLKAKVLLAASESSADDKSSSPSDAADADSLEDMFSDDNYETPEDRGVDPEYLARTKAGTMTAGMTGAIGFYKGWISPLLPPACRFVPTCSQYGVQAIQEFGPARGALLTAWRLMRCSPIGGRGYDPPRWPPVAFNYGNRIGGGIPPQL